MGKRTIEHVAAESYLPPLPSEIATHGSKASLLFFGEPATHPRLLLEWLETKGYTAQNGFSIESGFGLSLPSGRGAKLSPHIFLYVQPRKGSEQKILSLLADFRHHAIEKVGDVRLYPPFSRDGTALITFSGVRSNLKQKLAAARDLAREVGLKVSAMTYVNFHLANERVVGGDRPIVRLVGPAVKLEGVPLVHSTKQLEHEGPTLALREQIISLRELK